MKFAGDLGLDTKTFESCVDSKKYADEVQRETAEGQALGVNSTPFVFINNQLVRGALPYETFKATIEAALAGKK